MLKSRKFAALSLSALAVLTLSACGHDGQHEALRAEIAAVRAIAEEADAKATLAQADASQASADAAQAAADAQLAGEKADRIFREGLRK